MSIIEARDGAATVPEPVEQLISEMDPATAEPVGLRGRHYDLGALRVHFPPGPGGPGAPPLLPQVGDGDGRAERGLPRSQVPRS